MSVNPQAAGICTLLSEQLSCFLNYLQSFTKLQSKPFAAIIE